MVARDTLIHILKKIKYQDLEDKFKIEEEIESLADFEDDTVVSLKLANKKIKELPPEIAKLKYLKTLDLQENSLETVPETLGKLKKLETLDLSGNNLTSLPPTIGKLKKLKTLSLYYNRLDSLPNSITRLKNLEELDIHDNFDSDGKYVSSYPKYILKWLSELNSKGCTVYL